MLLPENTKLRLYKVLIKLTDLYDCGKWISTKSDGKKMFISEKKSDVYMNLRV